MNDGVKLSSSALSNRLTLCSPAEVVCMMWLMGWPGAVSRLLQLKAGARAACECADEVGVLGLCTLAQAAAGSRLLQVRAGCRALASKRTVLAGAG